jgi:SAM-dependent methyltransferase
MGLSAKEWSSPQNALAYLNVADNLPHRSEGESVLIDHLPENTKRVLDLGTRDGRLIRLIKENKPDLEEAVALDVSPTMLKSARDHFAGDSRIKYSGVVAMLKPEMAMMLSSLTSEREVDTSTILENI